MKNDRLLAFFEDKIDVDEVCSDENLNLKLRLCSAEYYMKCFHEGMVSFHRAIGSVEEQMRLHSAVKHERDHGSYYPGLNRINLSSKKWTTLTPHEIRQLNMEECAGVYIFYKMDKPHYIGESNDLPIRLTQHLNDILRWSAPFAFYVKVKLTKKRKTLERNLIRRLQPIGNVALK